jgi:hypothetical protein
VRGSCEPIPEVIPIGKRPNNDHVCFIIFDLSADNRFCHFSVVDSSIVQLRFYAETPIIINRGVNIRSFFIFDVKFRRGGLTLPYRKYKYFSTDCFLSIYYVSIINHVRLLIIT